MSILATIQNAQEFATLPPVAMKVLEMLDEDDVDFREIAKVIETDPAITMKILQMANSPLYAVRTTINNVQGAILALGLNRIANIVLSVSIFSKFIMMSRKSSAQLMERFWWHSSCTGMVSKSLATRLGLNFRENEFIGGLLHDIGKLAMIQFDIDSYKKVLDLVTNQGMTDSEAEVLVFGVDHETTGDLIAKLWRLPDDIRVIISQHSHPQGVGKSRDLVCVVRIADVLCELWGAGSDEGLREIELSELPAWAMLAESVPHLKDIDVAQFTFELESEFQNANSFLSAIMSEAVNN